MMKTGFIVTPTRMLKMAAAGAIAGLAVFVTQPPQPASANLAPVVSQELECLALTLYFEARGEPDEGKLAVGHVVMNRVADERYPDSVCDVVKQGGDEVLHRCQFSWWCDGRSDTPANIKSWKRAIALARAIFWGYSKDPTGGALSYHAKYVKPAWRKQLVKTAEIGQHIFYTPRDRLASREALVQPGPQTASSNQ